MNQPFSGVLLKARPQNFYKIYRKTSAPEPIFYKVVGVELASLF